MKLSDREIELQLMAKAKRDRLNSRAGAGMKQDAGRTVDRPKPVAKAKKVAKKKRSRG